MPAAIETLADGAEIARAAAIERQPRQRPRHVGRTAQRFARVLSVSAELARNQETASSRSVNVVGIGQGTDIRRSASSRPPPPVTVRSMVFSNPPRRSPDSVFRSSRLVRVAGSISQHRVDPVLSRSGGERHRPFRQLGLFDIGDDGCGCRQFGPRKRAKAVKCLHLEIGPRVGRPLGAAAVEQHRRLRRDRHRIRSELVELGPQAFLVKHACRRRSSPAGRRA